MAWLRSLRHRRTAAHPPTHLEPCTVLLVEAPGLPLELPRRQVLLMAAGLVVEDEEEGLRIQLLIQRGRLKDGGPLQAGRQAGSQCVLSDNEFNVCVCVGGWV